MDSADEAYDWFIYKLCLLYEERFNLRKRTRHKQSKKPWITRSILKIIRKKNKLYERFLDLDVLKMFKKWRNEVTSMLRKAKSAYYSKMFHNENRSDVIWKKNQLYL